MHVLLVEDSRRLQESIRLGLQRCGYAVDVAGDGEAALRYALHNPYDVIVLDLMLPKLDGLAVLRRLREESNDTHVLILTAKASVDERVHGLREGADDYLTKPFAFDELVARVEALVRRSYQEKRPVIEIGPLRIDTTARTVTARRQGDRPAAAGVRSSGVPGVPTGAGRLPHRDRGSPLRRAEPPDEQRRGPPRLEPAQADRVDRARPAAPHAARARLRAGGAPVMTGRGAMTSIRDRLVVTLVVGLAVVLSAGGAAVYWIARVSLLRQLDAGLRTRVMALSSLATSRNGAIEFDIDDEIDPIRGAWNSWFEFRAWDGTLLLRSDELGDEPLPARTPVKGGLLYENVALPAAGERVDAPGCCSFPARTVRSSPTSVRIPSSCARRSIAGRWSGRSRRSSGRWPAWVRSSR